MYLSIEMEGILFTNNTFALSATNSTTPISTYVAIGLTLLVAIPSVLLFGVVAIIKLMANKTDPSYLNFQNQQKLC
jgi:hypothetical protein